MKTNTFDCILKLSIRYLSHISCIPFSQNVNLTSRLLNENRHFEYPINYFSNKQKNWNNFQTEIYSDQIEE